MSDSQRALFAVAIPKFECTQRLGRVLELGPLTQEPAQLPVRVQSGVGLPIDLHDDPVAEEHGRVALFTSVYRCGELCHCLPGQGCGHVPGRHAAQLDPVVALAAPPHHQRQKLPREVRVGQRIAQHSVQALVAATRQAQQTRTGMFVQELFGIFVRHETDRQDIGLRLTVGVGDIHQQDLSLGCLSRHRQTHRRGQVERRDPPTLASEPAPPPQDRGQDCLNPRSAALVLEQGGPRRRRRDDGEPVAVARRFARGRL